MLYAADHEGILQGAYSYTDAEVCRPARLLGVANQPMAAATNGIRVWKLQDGVTRVVDGVVAP